MKNVTIDVQASVYSRVEVEVTDEQYELLKNGEEPENIIEDFDSLMHIALYEDPEGIAEIYEEGELRNW